MKKLIEKNGMWVPENFEENHRYYADPEGTKAYTGVTTVLGVLAKPALIGWAARMTAEWIRENCDECMYAETEADEKHYAVSDADLQEAVKAHTKKKEAGGEKGKDLHSEVEAYIKECIECGMNTIVVKDASKGLSEFINWAVHNNIRFLSSETPVYSREWWVAGTPDFTFEKDGKRYVGDLKTHKKIWDRVPHFQTAAYLKMLEEQDPLNTYHGTCIVNIDKETGLTDSWSYDTTGDRKAFEAALTLYRQLNTF